MDRFLKAKHWQIFMVTFGIPLILELILIPFIIVSNDFRSMNILFPIITLFFVGGFFGWFWSIGTGLQYKVPEGVKMKVKKFKTFLLIPLIYMVVILGFMGFSFGGAMESGQEPRGGQIGGIIGLIVLLHLFSMFCIFYCLYFVAKTFKTVELQREVTFSDFAGEFFLIWFFPIGIWIIQPKINKMIEN
jgi:hypothetical protein